ncbi:MobF family relaxase [Streptomyces sp. W4I9-2]|uniref:MobF family relaxase n=1 Tax=Streptomyces sp. W4I9-2 TaxID=3042297 RepID=UPI0027D7E45D|nr:MobF family relaxase [Streptomyces sp. W4I9-2]
MGRGLAALGLTEGAQVSERQLELVFGQGRHPAADRIEQRLLDDGADRAAARRATVLGQPIEEIEARKQTPPLALDFTFRPQASLIAVWALGDAHTRRVIERAHERAVATALRWIEDEVAETRWSSGCGRAKTSALVVAAFRHFDNRDGFPLLHEHCLVLNRVQRRGEDGEPVWGAGRGGLRTPISTWSGSEQPWCSGLGPTELMEEVDHLRTACWITIAFLSGMRDVEVRELSRDCKDCFYQAPTAVCSKRAQSLGRPLPLHNMCLSCPNSRRSSVHLPRLTLAREGPVREGSHSRRLRTTSAPPTHRAARVQPAAGRPHHRDHRHGPGTTAHMSDATALRIRQAFERLTADHPALTSNDQALMQVFERLIHGLTGRFRMKFHVPLGSWVMCRQDLLGVC